MSDVAGSVRFLDPRGIPIDPQQPYLPRLDIGARALRIGFVNNRFPDAVVFAEALASALKSHLSDMSIVRYPGVLDRLTSDLADDVADHADAAVLLYGH